MHRLSRKPDKCGDPVLLVLTRLHSFFELRRSPCRRLTLFYFTEVGRVIKLVGNQPRRSTRLCACAVFSASSNAHPSQTFVRLVAGW